MESERETCADDGWGDTFFCEPDSFPVLGRLSSGVLVRFVDLLALATAVTWIENR